MSNIINQIILPILVAVIALGIEYWIVQPIRNKDNQGHERRESIQQIGELGIALTRLLRQAFSPNTYKLSSTIVRTIGNFFVLFIPWIIASLISLAAIFFSLPFYIGLYFSEKFSHCKFHPSCKEYLVLAIEFHGPVRGLVLATNRFGRCSPLSKGGKDVPRENITDQHLMKSLFTKGNWRSTLLGFLVLTMLSAVFVQLILKVNLSLFPEKFFFLGLLLSALVTLIVITIISFAVSLFVFLVKQSRLLRVIIIIIIGIYLMKSVVVELITFIQLHL